MQNFFPNQRWISEAEPELGIGIVTETSKGRVRIFFPGSEETRLYASSSAPLRRVKFKPGETIIDEIGRSLEVERVREEENLLVYSGQGRSIREEDLGIITVNHGPNDRILQGDIDTPRTFALRRRTLENDHNRKISPVNGFLGGRIDLIAHQLYIAHEVSSRYAPRVLLSDEVGLGKTIEACLILHRLLISGRISRVLILVPESLVHQWFVELLRRFNLWFHIFDEERCAASEAGAPEGNPFLDDQLIICSTNFLSTSPSRAVQALQANWDMLVVDEAHHLEWSVEQASPSYQLVELLGKVADGLLLLTATPEQLGLESHFARLRLLDPDRYLDFDSFQNESDDHQSTADLVDKLAQGKKLAPKDEKVLGDVFGKERLLALKEGSEVVKDNLIEDLLDQHGPGRVIFRNTRAAMKGFPVRIADLVGLEAQFDHDRWLDRLGKEFEADLQPPGVGGGQAKFYFAQDPRVWWLTDFMQGIKPAKVLLICRTKEKVLALETALRELANIKAGVFHEDLTIVQRDRNAAWFSEPNGTRLLLCSEIGSEGRNFQFAQHLVLFDLPAQPELLEQRIGRLDRIGQTNDIHIHIPFLLGSPQEALVSWYHDGLNAFEQNLEGGNQIARLFGDQLSRIAFGMPAARAYGDLHELVRQTHAFHSELKTKLAKGRDRLLEMNSFRPKVAEELVEQIRSEDQSNGLESYMNDVFETFGVEIEDLDPRTYLLHPPAQNITFPGISEQGIMVTFDRKRALSREEVSFLSWDHPMITGAIDLVLSTGTGSASFGVLRGERKPGFLLEAMFVLETAGAQNSTINRFLPNTPIRIVVDHRGQDVTADFPVEEVDSQLIRGPVDLLMDNEVLLETVLPSMIEKASETADKRGQVEKKFGLRRMEEALNHEINRLNILQEKNTSIRPEEIKIAEKERENLSLLINSAQIRLDSMQLIQIGR